MPKKPNGEGSIFKLPGGRWKATISMGTDREGKRRRRSKTARSRADAHAFLREMQAESAAGATPEPTRLTILQFLTWWLKDTIQPNAAESTLNSYTRAANNHIGPTIGHILLKHASPIHVQQMLTLLAEKFTGKIRTRQIAFEVLRSALSHALRLRLIRGENPCSAIQKPKGTRKQIRPLTEAEARKLLNVAEPSRLHALIVVALTAGLRQGELFGLHWDHLDLVTGRLRVEQQVAEVAGKLTVRKPKTAGSIRTIELTQMAIDALQAHRAAMLREGNAASPIIFCGRRGGYIGRGNFRVRFWKPLLKQAGIEYRGFHHIRHTFATLALGAGVPVHVVSSVLGHAKAATTLNIYAHILDQQNTAATAAIARLFG